MATVKKPLPKIEVGQVWRDMDKRVGARFLVVESVEGTRATCRIYVGMDGFDTGRTTRIAFARFKPGSTGYERVKAVGSYDRVEEAP